MEKLCPCCGTLMTQAYILLDPFQTGVGTLDVLVCTNTNVCQYWIPCSRTGKVPLSKAEQEKLDV